MRQFERRLRIPWLTALLVPLLALPLACGDDDSEATPTSTEPSPADVDAEGVSDPFSESEIEEARAEGGLVWYTSGDPQSMEVATTAFEDRFGIDVTATRIVGAQLAQRFAAESDAGQHTADLVTHVDVAFLRDMGESGYFADLKPDEIPSLEDIPDEYFLELDDGDRTSVILSFLPAVFGYNTDVIDGPPPETWEDLLDPRFKGQILVVDPRNTAAWMNMFDLVYHHPDLGPEYLEALAEQDLRFVESAAPGGELLAAGEGAVLVPSVLPIQDALSKAGAPVADTLIPIQTTTDQYLSLSSNAPHPKSARLFMNWLLSEEGQSLYTEASLTASPLGDIPGATPLPEGAVAANPDRAAETLPKIVEIFGL